MLLRYGLVTLGTIFHKAQVQIIIKKSDETKTSVAKSKDTVSLLNTYLSLT